MGEMNNDALKITYNNLDPNSEPEKDFYSGAELIERDVEVLPTLLDPIFPKVGSVAIAGGSDIGKSTFLRQFAIAVSVGDKDFLGWTLNAEHNRAIVVSTEDFKDLMTIPKLIKKGDYLLRNTMGCHLCS